MRRVWLVGQLVTALRIAAFGEWWAARVARKLSERTPRQ